MTNMKKKQKIVAIILARGGSKGLPRKNIRPLTGKPLVAYTIEAALESKYLDRVIVSSEDKEIMKVAKEYGAEAPFRRPAKYAIDSASAESVIQHAVLWLEEKEKYYPDIIVYMQTTSPVRRKGLVDEVVEKFIESKADTVLTAWPNDHYFWRKSGEKIKRIDVYLKDGKTKVKKDEYANRQNKDWLYMENGSVYAIKPALAKKGKRLGKKIAIVEDDELGSIVDIHDQFDWWLAEQIIRKYKNIK